MMTDPEPTTPRDEPTCAAGLTDKDCTEPRPDAEPSAYQPPREFPTDDRSPCQQPADW